MAPRRPPLAQSESKARFFGRLGLDERLETHRRVYAMMKEEAVEGRQRVTTRPDSLAPHFRNDPTVEPPYSSSQISETAFRREIMNIYRTARTETKPIYDLGHDRDRVEEENWVIRWMLWHVFRYRDSRNRNRRTISPGDDKGDSEREDSPDASNKRSAKSVASSGQTRYWDPVRDT